MLKIDRIALHLPAGMAHDAGALARHLGQHLAALHGAGALAAVSTERVVVRVAAAPPAHLPAAVNAAVAARLGRRGGPR
jgi:hypothetical protein